MRTGHSVWSLHLVLLGSIIVGLVAQKIYFMPLTPMERGNYPGVYDLSYIDCNNVNHKVRMY